MLDNMPKAPYILGLLPEILVILIMTTANKWIILLHSSSDNSTTVHNVVHALNCTVALGSLGHQITNLYTIDRLAEYFY